MMKSPRVEGEHSVTVERAIAVISAAAIVASLVFLALEARSLKRSNELQTDALHVAAVQGSLQQLDGVVKEFLDRPWMLPHFYDGWELPLDRAQRGQVLLMAEMIADVIEGALQASAITNHFRSNRTSWEAYAQDLLRLSPAFQQTLATHTAWYPQLRALVPIPSART